MSDKDIGEVGRAPWRHDETMTTPAGGESARPCTVKDIARLAGVSTATVSRVVNGTGTVSLKTKTKVLAAILRAHYSPNAHAALLGRENGGIPRKHASELTDWSERKVRRSSCL